MFEVYVEEDYDWYLYGYDFVGYVGVDYGVDDIGGYYLVVKYIVDEKG